MDFNEANNTYVCLSVLHVSHLFNQIQESISVKLQKIRLPSHSLIYIRNVKVTFQWKRDRPNVKIILILRYSVV